jgi:hypothetical protein
LKELCDLVLIFLIQSILANIAMCFGISGTNMHLSDLNQDRVNPIWLIVDLLFLHVWWNSIAQNANKKDMSAVLILYLFREEFILDLDLLAWCPKYIWLMPIFSSYATFRSWSLSRVDYVICAIKIQHIILFAQKMKNKVTVHLIKVGAFLDCLHRS